LFPNESLNVVHSSASLNWISKVPKEITDRSSAAWNKGRIHYTNAPKEVIDAYANQYQKDMEIFLHARAQELVGNGLMALQIPAATDVTFDSDFYCGKNFELLRTCLVDMAKEVRNLPTIIINRTFSRMKYKQKRIQKIKCI